MPFLYESGEEVQPGDKIVYGGSPGHVEFVVEAPIGDPAIDWYLTQFPDGGFMVKTAAFGPIFLDSVDEDLEFVERMPE